MSGYITWDQLKVELRARDPEAFDREEAEIARELAEERPLTGLAKVAVDVVCRTVGCYSVFDRRYDWPHRLCLWLVSTPAARRRERAWRRGTDRS